MVNGTPLPIFRAPSARLRPYCPLINGVPLTYLEYGGYDMKNLQFSCAFTGHRPHKLPWGYDEDDERCIAVKGALAGQIAVLAESHGITDFYSGMADGSDVWAAQAVLELRRARPVRLHCIVPHRGQADRWNRAARDRYGDILDRADNVMTLAERYYDGCMQTRNRYMIDAAGTLLAVYDGTKGGTAMTVDYARRQGRRIIVIDPVARVIRGAAKAQADIARIREKD